MSSKEKRTATREGENEKGFARGVVSSRKCVFLWGLGNRNWETRGKRAMGGYSQGDEVVKRFSLRSWRTRSTVNEGDKGKFIAALHVDDREGLEMPCLAEFGAKKYRGLRRHNNQFKYDRGHRM